MTESIYIENLKCGGCVNSIKKAFLALPNVESIEIDQEESRVDIMTKDADNRSLFVEKLASLGYPEIGQNDMIKKAKSYVSCAIGRMSKSEN